LDDEDGETHRFMENILDPFPANADKNLTSLSSILDKLGGSNGTIGSFGSGDIKSTLFNLYTSLVNQTKSTVPLIATKGNYTLLQAALFFAIGSMAAGAAVLALEGLVFRKRETEIEEYHQYHDALEQGLHQSPYLGPDLTYGAPHSRRKRDTEYSYSTNQWLPIVKPFHYPHPQRKPPDTSASSLIPLKKYRQPSQTQTQQGRIHIVKPTYGLGYPDPSDILMLNRLGVKRRKKPIAKRRKGGQNNDDEDDDIEHGRSGLLVGRRKRRNKKKKNPKKSQ